MGVTLILWITSYTSSAHAHTHARTRARTHISLLRRWNHWPIPFRRCGDSGLLISYTAITKGNFYYWWIVWSSWNPSQGLESMSHWGKLRFRYFLHTYGVCKSHGVRMKPSPHIFMHFCFSSSFCFSYFSIFSSIFTSLLNLPIL
jgi:hypothetical protein